MHAFEITYNNNNKIECLQMRMLPLSFVFWEYANVWFSGANQLRRLDARYSGRALEAESSAERRIKPLEPASRSQSEESHGRKLNRKLPW